jgi:hypothetical protein
MQAQVPAHYESPFGSGAKPGTVYSFPDFQIEFLYQRGLNAQEQAVKDRLDTEGMDGGGPSPQNGFRITPKKGKAFELEHGIFPFANTLFEADGKGFLLTNSGLKEKEPWVITGPDTEEYKKLKKMYGEHAVKKAK